MVGDMVLNKVGGIMLNKVGDIGGFKTCVDRS